MYVPMENKLLTYLLTMRIIISVCIFSQPFCYFLPQVTCINITPVILFQIRFKNLKMLLKTTRSLLKNNQTEPIVSVVNSLLLLLLLQRTSVLHQVAVELGLVSFLLLQIDASDKAAPVQLHVVLFFVTGRQIGNITLLRLVHMNQKHIYTHATASIQGIQCVGVCSHRVVVGGGVFGGVPLKHELPVIQVASSPAFLDPAKVTLL